ncbi:MAG: hypothetical protein ACTSXF_10960 [Promethearchaeota archaeon]
MPNNSDGLVPNLHSKRDDIDKEEDPWQNNRPRLGRRETEPQSIEITRIYDILTTNFEKGRTMSDLDYFFEKDGKKYHAQFDISYFKGLKIDYTLSFYDAKQYNNMVPTMVINILAKNTYLKDFSVHMKTCYDLKIPIYILFSTFDFEVKTYAPPFLMAYILKEDGDYLLKALEEESYDETGELRKDKLIDLRPHLPFKIGIVKTERKHENNTYNYDLLLLNAETLEIYKTRLEYEREKMLEAEKAEREAEEAGREAEEAEREAEEAEREAEEAGREAEKERAMRIKAEEELKKLKETLNNLEK